MSERDAVVFEILGRIVAVAFQNEAAGVFDLAKLAEEKTPAYLIIAREFFPFPPVNMGATLANGMELRVREDEGPQTSGWWHIELRGGKK